MTIFWIFISLITSTMDQPVVLKNLLPDTISVYKIANEENYTKENLYDYINGGAELFNSYGFRNLYSCTFQAEEQPDIIVDIFDMGSSLDAFGVFSYSMFESEYQYGQGSQTSKGMIVFWMDKYYISIISYPETDESKNAIDKLASYISEKIGKRGELPQILEFLPEKGLNRESIKYFHHYIWLNSLYFISHENILDIQDDTPAILAKYGNEQSKTILLLILYPDEARARKALFHFNSLYVPDHDGNEPLKIEDGTYVHYSLKKQLLSIVFNAGSSKECKDLLHQVDELYKY